jgi:RNA polymerase sigma-70 factor, ECF subfamily
MKRLGRGLDVVTPSRRQRVNGIALDDVLPSLERDGRHFEPMDDWSNRIDDAALQVEVRQVLSDAIAALPVDYAATLVLHDVEGMPALDIAEALGLSLPGVRSRVHRSRLFLRKRLSEHLKAG